MEVSQATAHLKPRLSCAFLINPSRRRPNPIPLKRVFKGKSVSWEMSLSVLQIPPEYRAA